MCGLCFSIVVCPDLGALQTNQPTHRSKNNNANVRKNPRSNIDAHHFPNYILPTAKLQSHRYTTYLPMYVLLAARLFFLFFKPTEG